MFPTERRVKNKLLQRERDRIKKDEELTDRIAVMESNKSAQYKAEFESSAQTCSAKALQLWQRAQHRETQLAQEAHTLVRRANLKALLQREEEQYNIEFQQRGLIIYKQRL